MLDIAPWLPATLLPVQKLAKQRVAPGWIVGNDSPGVGQELLELASLRFSRRRSPIPGEPVVGGFEALPTGDRQADARLLPFRMPRGFVEFLDPGEERVHE